MHMLISSHKITLLTFIRQKWSRGCGSNVYTHKICPEGDRKGPAQHLPYCSQGESRDPPCCSKANLGRQRTCPPRPRKPRKPPPKNLNNERVCQPYNLVRSSNHYKYACFWIPEFKNRSHSAAKWKLQTTSNDKTRGKVLGMTCVTHHVYSKIDVFESTSLQFSINTHTIASRNSFPTIIIT